MKKPVKTFQVASLFEGSNYVAIISDKTVNIIKHVYYGQVSEHKETETVILPELTK